MKDTICEFCIFLSREDQKGADYTLALVKKPKGHYVQKYEDLIYDMGKDDNGYPINYCPVCGKKVKK